MGFVNYRETILRKSNGTLLNFYVKKKMLFYREFESKCGWSNEQEILKKIYDNQFSVKIDKEDKVYGILSDENGDVFYLYTDENEMIQYKKLFGYDIKKYKLKYPYIIKIDTDIHIIYYLQDINDIRVWSIFSHYFDGNEWTQNNIDFIVSYPTINLFSINVDNDMLSIFYLNMINGVEQIFYSKFDKENKIWSKGVQIINTNNKKMYLNVLKDESNTHHITWSEFIDNNLVIRYVNGITKEDFIVNSEIISLSEQSNCSFPTFVKTKSALWNIWVQTNKLYSCYSLDNGMTWSETEEVKESINIDFIRYNFESNNKDDIDNFKLYNTFGMNYPRISFIGFKNI